jgi:hypothetical protein
LEIVLGTEKFALLTTGRKHAKKLLLAMPPKPYMCDQDRYKFYREPKIVLYSPKKMGRKYEKVSFGDAPQTMSRWSHSLEIVSGTKFCAQ